MNYIPAIVSRLVLQTLESTYFMLSSPNIDTVIGRYKFLMGPILELQSYSFDLRYLSDMQIGLDNYKQMYYDRITDDLQISIITKPSLYLLNTVYLINVPRVYDMAIKEYESALTSLKRKTAIQRRHEKMWNDIYQLKKSLATVFTGNEETDAIVSGLFEHLEEACKTVERNMLER